MHARRAPGLANAAVHTRASGLANAAMYALGAACTLLACGSSTRTPLAKAGAERDEGAGDLARASLRLSSSASTTSELDTFTERDRPVSRYDNYPYNYGAFGGSIYGGDPYGGMAYGGTGYANWVIPQWSYNPPNRIPRYNIVGGLASAIEGTVTWVGPPPANVATACGSIENPTLHVGTDKAARGVIVYIEKVVTGRAVPLYTRPVSVGGTIAKRGCALVPAAQIVAPLPGAITVHGDNAKTKLKLTPAGDKPKTVTQELQEAGFVQIEAKAGVTRVESDDGRLSPAWVIGLETPYYAITDDTGRYRIDELAPGTYEVTFWQAPVATTNASGVFTYGAPIVTKRTVKVGAKTSQLSVSIGR